MKFRLKNRIFTLVESRQRRTNSRINPVVAGFTLIELLVVISIISLLASVVMAGLQDARNKANQAYTNQTVGEYIKAIEAYQLDNGYYPTPDAFDPTYEAYCLGDYPFATNRFQADKCGGSSFYSSKNTGLNDALAPYISGNPPATTNDVAIRTTIYWRGATYLCLSANDANQCTQFEITWAIYYPSATCPYGAESDSFLKGTLCFLQRGN